jgi:hypothetical protein
VFPLRESSSGHGETSTNKNVSKFHVFNFDQNHSKTFGFVFKFLSEISVVSGFFYPYFATGGFHSYPQTSLKVPERVLCGAGKCRKAGEEIAPGCS